MPHTQHAKTTKSHQTLHWQKALHEQDARPQLQTKTQRKTRSARCQNSAVMEWEAHHSHWPVASFLWPRKTWSSSFRFRMSKSLQRWSRDAVSSQLPLRFNFTSITVFLWAWLETKNQENNPGSEFKTSLNQWSFIFLEKYMVVKLARRLA